MVVSDRFPTDGHHGRKFIAFGPDGKLYVPVGAPCNICEPDPDRYADHQRMNPDGSGLEVFARGVRNTVGFDWHPQTKELWFTDNGRDMLGDDAAARRAQPRAARRACTSAIPYCHGGTIPDPSSGAKRPCSEFAPPAQNLGPHVARSACASTRGRSFRPRYRNQIFIAEHGSWNRSRKIGYRVTLVQLDGGKAVALRALRRRLAAGRERVGAPGGRAGRAGRLAAGVRRLRQAPSTASATRGP